jgi:hypothetical protein
MHHALVNYDLLLLLAIGSIVIELESLHELVLVVGIPLIGLDDGHAPLICLDDVHREIFHVVLIIFRDQVTFDSDCFFVIFVVLVRIVASGKLEELLAGVLGHCSHAVHVLAEGLDAGAPSGIFGSLVAQTQHIQSISLTFDRMFLLITVTFLVYNLSF